MPDLVTTDLAHRWNAHDAPSGLVDEWPDSIGSKDFTASGDERPTRSAVNGKPGVLGDGTDDMLQAGTGADWAKLHNSAGCTIFVVLTLADADPDDLMQIIDTGNGEDGVQILLDNRAAYPNRLSMAVYAGDQAVVSTTVADSIDAIEPQRTHVLAFRWSGTKEEDGLAAWLNGVFNNGSTTRDATVSAADAAEPLTLFRLAASNARNAKVYIHDLLIHESELSEADMQQQMRHLAELWDAPTIYPVAEGTIGGLDYRFAPSLVEADGGFYCFYYAAAGHPGTSTDATLSYKFASTIQGLEAADETVLITPPEGYTLVNAWVTRIDGKWYITYNFYEEGVGHDVDTCWVACGTNLGDLTEVNITGEFTGADFVPSPVRKLGDGGSLGFTMGGHNGNNDHRDEILMRSTDGGANWSRLSTIEGGIAGEYSVSEADIHVLADGRLLALIRSASGEVYQRISTDNGATWGSRSDTTLASGHPIIDRTSSGRLWSPMRIVGNDAQGLSSEVYFERYTDTDFSADTQVIGDGRYRRMSYRGPLYEAPRPTAGMRAGDLAFCYGLDVDPGPGAADACDIYIQVLRQPYNPLTEQAELRAHYAAYRRALRSRMPGLRRLRHLRRLGA